MKHYKNIEMCSTHLAVFTTVPNECIETCMSVQDTNCRLEVSRLCDFDLHNFFSSVLTQKALAIAISL